MVKFHIAMGADHAGYELKEQLKQWLQKKNKRIRDYGTFSAESVDYPDFVHPLAEAVEQGYIPFGIVICGSGNGVAMTANKWQGIRAALCWKPEIAKLAKEHNNANIIALPARHISLSMAKRIVNAFLRAKFEGGRHQKRIDKIPVIH